MGGGRAPWVCPLKSSENYRLKTDKFIFKIHVQWTDIGQDLNYRPRKGRAPKLAGKVGPL